MPTGIPGLDSVLRGGFLKAGIYIVRGEPGTGKTIFGNQFSFNHVAAGHCPSIPELRRCRARPRHRGNRCRLVRNSALLSIIAPSSGRGSLFTGSGIPAAAPLIIPSLIGEGRLGAWAIVAKQTKSRDHLFGLVSFRCCMEGSVCHRWAGATWRQES